MNNDFLNARGMYDKYCISIHVLFVILEQNQIAAIAPTLLRQILAQVQSTEGTYNLKQYNRILCGPYSI